MFAPKPRSKRGDSNRVSEYLRGNALGLIAIFIALGGTAFAVGKAPKNSVVSKSIKDGVVKGKDVNSSQVQLRVDGACPAGQAIRVVNVDGGVLCEVGGEPATGPAGGDLTGTYPDPELDVGVVGEPELADNAVVGDALGSQDIADDSIGTNDIAEYRLDFIGRTGGAIAPDGVCEDDDGNGEDCAAQTLTLTRPARVLLVANGYGFATALDDPDNGADVTTRVDGRCGFRVDGADQGNSQLMTLFGVGDSGLSAAMVTGGLGAGPHTFVWRCTEQDGNIDFSGAAISAVVLSAE